MDGLCRTPSAALALALALALAPACFAEQRISAEVKLQQQILLSRAPSKGESLTSASLRLKLDHARGPWSADFHYLLGLRRGGAEPGHPVAEELFDWESEASDVADGAVSHRIDRLSFAYAKGDASLRVGRQAITWGRGSVFRPLDLFNPFAPDSFDTSYKPGTDMVHFQRLLASGGDLQILLVPGREEGNLSWRGSSAAAKAYLPGNADIEFTIAGDHGDAVIGLGASLPAGEGLLGFDLVANSRSGGGVAVTGVANCQTSWTWRGSPVLAFAEYYRNGFGVRDPGSGGDLPRALEERRRRGQLFVDGRNYVAVGASAEWTPLLSVAPTALANLDDGSGQFILDATYSVDQNLSLAAGIRVPIGPLGTEFGGRRTRTGEELEGRPQATVLLRLEAYF